VPAGGSYVLGQPLVRRSTLTLPGRRPLIIERRDTRGPMRARLDGAVVEATAVPHALIAAGGRLVFEGRRGP
jgi:putative alpha-1,2-mannosidase